MNPNVYFIHTVSNLYPQFNALAATHIPQAKLTHISDESLIQRALAAGGLTPEIEERLFENIKAAEKAGADFIQVTCSSMTPAVIAFKEKIKVPLLTIDEPVVTKLVNQYPRIGVIATASSTLNPSTKLVKDIAVQLGKNTKVISRFCEGAYDAYFSGNLEKHDEIISKNLKNLITSVDVILLAQVSMARIADTLTNTEKVIPIEISPDYAIQHLANLINKS